MARKPTKPAGKARGKIAAAPKKKAKARTKKPSKAARKKAARAEQKNFGGTSVQDITDPAFRSAVVQAAQHADSMSFVEPAPARLTVEEQYRADLVEAADRGAGRRRPSWWTRFKSSVSGLFVSPEAAAADPDRTQGTRLRRESQD
jgi:hypothetical protein